MLLNLGSGQRRFARECGWINVDCVSREGEEPDVLHDLRQPLPWPDDSSEMVMLYHVAEHLRSEEAEVLIRECYRVLQPKCSLIVVVPDMRALAQRWLVRQMDDNLYMTNVYGAWRGAEGDAHQWGYTHDSLKAAVICGLQDRGTWSEVKAFDWRKIPGTDCVKDFWYFGIEAVK